MSPDSLDHGIKDQFAAVAQQSPRVVLCPEIAKEYDWGDGSENKDGENCR
jgi:hypothetical protein